MVDTQRERLQTCLARLQQATSSQAVILMRPDGTLIAWHGLGTDSEAAMLCAALARVVAQKRHIQARSRLVDWISVADNAILVFCHKAPPRRPRLQRRDLLAEHPELSHRAPVGSAYTEAPSRFTVEPAAPEPWVELQQLLGALSVEHHLQTHPRYWSMP